MYRTQLEVSNYVFSFIEMSLAHFLALMCNVLSHFSWFFTRNFNIFYGQTTDIERRSQNSYTAPCNVTVSHGPPIGGTGVLPPPHAETNVNKTLIFTRSATFHACLSSHSDRSTYAPDKSWLPLIVGKTWISLIGALCRDKDGAGSGISSLYLWAKPKAPCTF